MGEPRVALVHDYLLVRRGAERTFEAIAECWPQAPIYTLLYDEEGTEGRYARREVRTSYLQRLGVGQAGFRRLLPAFPRAARSLDLSGYDLVVSSSSAFGHMVRAAPGARHLCYCHTPFRYAWFEHERALAEVPAPLRPLLRRSLGRVRERDRAAAAAVSAYLANSELTRERIAVCWGRDSEVVHPPVEVERFAAAAEVRPSADRAAAEPALLIVTELVSHKRVELALEAATRARLPIRVVGEGPERARLEARYAGTGAEFLGRVGDADLERLYASTLALILPNVEEFGIAAVEAQAAGRPVVAAAAGGALETVRGGETGVLVAPDDLEALTGALARTDFTRFDRDQIARHAATFSKAAFQERLRAAASELAAQPGRLSARSC